MANTLQGLAVVRSETHVEIEWVRERIREVELSSPEEESAYFATDLELAKRIEALIEASSQGTPKEHLLCTNDDWWPNRSRNVTLYARALTAETLVALQSLLVGEYSAWRIFVNVVESPQTQAEVGTMFFTQDRAVVQHSVHERVQRVA